MMREFMLEVCTDSVESAAAAVRGGARRLEVCANLVIGGTTPGVSQFKQMRKACDIPLNYCARDMETFCIQRQNLRCFWKTRQCFGNLGRTA